MRMRKNLNDTLWRTRQDPAEAKDKPAEPAAPLVPAQIDYAALGNAPPKNLGALSERALRLRHMRRPPLGACVTAEILGGKA